MAYEYAIEPEALLSRQDRRYLVDNLGVDTGRLVAQYPDDWIARVQQACAAFQPLEKLGLTEDLKMLRRRMVKTNRLYASELAWLRNALNAHIHDPFKAILVAHDNTDPATIRALDLRKETPAWSIPSDGKVQRSAKHLVEVAGPLLRLSSVILFVDQHYKTTANFGRPLAGFLKEAQEGKTPHRIEYHLNAEAPLEAFVSGLDRQRKHLGLHSNLNLVFVRWEQIDEGENQHPRYILTNRGGLRFDYGLDEGSGTTDWNRLSEQLWEERRSQFNPSAGVFKFVDAYRVIEDSVEKVAPYNGAWK
jgi:hypothetical protein